jgi:hypothetical protein
MFARSDIYFRLHLLLIIIYFTCISLSLRRTSASIHLTSVLGELGTQETSCIVIAGLLERDSFDILLPEFDKPWVIHLRETCCCSTNLYTWRPNSVYKNRSICRHQWYLRRGGILTKDNLAKGNWHGNKSCVYCHHDEIIKHLFFQCRFARSIWSIIQVVSTLYPPCSVANIFGN